MINTIEGKLSKLSQNLLNLSLVEDEREYGKLLNMIHLVDHKVYRDGVNVILIYPIPEAGWNIPSKVLNKFFVKKNKINNKNYVTTSYLVYKNRNKSSFDLLDSIKGKNIHRIYPNEIFCDSLIKKRCITHNDKDIFYSDHNHLSYIGSIMINDLIMEKLKKILD